MPSSSFPGASHTFSCYPRLQTTKVGNNITPVAPLSLTPIATGLSIALKDVQDTIVTDKFTVFTGMYSGATFVDTPILLGNILADETENDNAGNPVRYSVEGLTRYVFYVKLHLKRLDIGV